MKTIHIGIGNNISMSIQGNVMTNVGNDIIREIWLNIFRNTKKIIHNKITFNIRNNIVDISYVSSLSSQTKLAIENQIQEQL